MNNIKSYIETLRGHRPLARLGAYRDKGFQPLVGIIMILLLSISSLSVSAQNEKISGFIGCKDDNGNPIVGCQVITGFNGQQIYAVVNQWTCQGQDDADLIIEWGDPVTGNPVYLELLPGICAIFGGSETITTLVNNGDGTYTFTSEDGTTTTITVDGNTSVVTDTNTNTNVQVIATHDDGDGTTVNIEETITTLVDNGDGTYTSTSEDGTVTTINTTTVVDNGDGTGTITDVSGDVIDVCIAPCGGDITQTTNHYTANDSLWVDVDSLFSDGVLISVTLDTLNFKEMFRTNACLPPLVFKDCDSTAPNVPITFDICGNDIGQDSDIDISTVEFKPTGNVTGTQGGTYAYNGDCTVTYTPVLNTTNYTDTIQYCVQDQEGDYSNHANIIVDVEGDLCATATFTDNDTEGCSTGRAVQRNTFTITDGFGNALTAGDIVDFNFTNCADGSTIGTLSYDYADLATGSPTTSNPDLAANYSMTMTSATEFDLAFRKRDFATATNGRYSCCIDICLEISVTDQDMCDGQAFVSTNNTQFPTKPDNIGHYTALQITEHDFNGAPSSSQHQATNSWLEDSTAECTRASHTFTGGWPSLAEGNGEQSTIYLSQNSGTPAWTIDGGTTDLVAYDGMCVDGNGDPFLATFQLNGCVGSPSYASGTAGEGYIVLEGLNTDGFRGISTTYINNPHNLANGGILSFAAPSNHPILFTPSTEKDVVIRQYFGNIVRSGVYANETIQSAVLTVTKNGSITPVNATAPITTTVTGGTVVYTGPVTVSAGGVIGHGTTPFEWIYGTKYLYELRVVFDSGREIINISETQIVCSY